VDKMKLVSKIRKIPSIIITNFSFIYYVLLALAIFYPLLAPGYILTLDTIWAANRNYIVEYIFCNSIGGQIPFLAIIQFFELFLPAMFIQKVILFSVFLISGISAHISVPSKSTVGKYFGGTLYAVNPFIYTRFLAGHLYLLLAYAFAPFAIKSFYDFLQDNNKWKKALLWTTIVAIFTPHVFFMVLLIQMCIFIFVINDVRNEKISIIKNTLRFYLVFLITNMFWILPVLLSVSAGSSILRNISDFDLTAFTGRGTISGNILISIAMMYGFWRGGYIYPFHLAPKSIFLLLFTVLLFFTVHGFLSNTKKPLHRGLALSAIFSLVLASGVTYQYFASIFEYLFEHFFIFKGMRDSQKFVGVLVLVYSFLGSAGVDELVSSFKSNKRIEALSVEKQQIYSIMMAVLILIVPLIYSFTIFNGFYDQIEPKDYPPEWYEINEFLVGDTEDFDVLFLPWHMYMTFEWSGRRIANPASIFFKKPIISGQNAEVGNILTQSSNPTQQYIGYLLEHKTDINNLGELLTPLNVKYVILTKDVDYRVYDFLYDQSDLELVKENKALVVFKNLHNTSRIREVTSIKSIMDWSDLVEQSKTTEIYNYGFILTSNDPYEIGPESPATVKNIKYTKISPLKYQFFNTSEYVIFTSSTHDQNGWSINGNDSLDSTGLYSVFKVNESNENSEYIYYEPYLLHLIGSIFSLVAILFLSYPYIQRR
jgi:hypothetical protein